MKETIEYYYLVQVDNLNVDNNTYNFFYNGFWYFFVHYNRTEKEFEDILKCSSEIKNKGIKTHQIILNKENSFFTKVEDLVYVLIQVENKDEVFDIVDIINFNKKFKLGLNKSELYRNNWVELWSAKINYLEKQLNELSAGSIVNSSVDYYIGLTENAIYFVNLVNLKYKISDFDNIVLSRKRVYFPNYNLSYFNPLNFIFDLEVRDVAEYIKSIFFADEDAFLELETFLKMVKLTDYSYNMLFARFLYPSYYFDIYEQVINKNISSEFIIKIINKANDYENFIKKAYLEISKYAHLEKINWLIKER